MLPQLHFHIAIAGRLRPGVSVLARLAVHERERLPPAHQEAPAHTTAQAASEKTQRLLSLGAFGPCPCQPSVLETRQRLAGPGKS